MKNKKSKESEEKKLNGYLSLGYTIGLGFTILAIITGLLARNDFFYRLGIVILIATPVAGIIIGIIYYITRKNLRNIFVGIAVFLILTASAFIGLLNLR